MTETTIKQRKENLLEVNNLKTYYPIKGGFIKRQSDM